MEDKKKQLLLALKRNNGKIDEGTIGASIGLSEKELDQALTELVDEGKLEFQSFGVCSYRVTWR